MREFLFWFVRPFAEFLGFCALVLSVAFTIWLFLVICEWWNRRNRRKTNQ